MRNFGDFPDTLTQYNNSEVVILPVPYDGTSTWLKGANKAVEIGYLASFECLFDNEIVVCREDLFCKVAI